MPEPHRLRSPLRRRRPERKQRQFRRRLRAYRMARGRPRRQIPRAAVPSFFTLMNLFSGYLAITQIHDGRYDYACWLIVLAGFFDLLDGMMARLTHGQSLFGVELDSLSDIVSFGVAPSYLVYAFGLKDFGVFGLIVSSLPAICGAVRLARYNVTFDGEKEDTFDGLPTPVQAITIVALILNVNDAGSFYRFSLSNLSVLIPIVFVLSGLMVSTISFDALPKPTPRYIRANPIKSLGFAVALLLLVFLQQIGLLIVLSVYILFGIGRAVYRLVLAVMKTPLEEKASKEEGH
ncbi:MAG: CDP-diacylglycerol--serine O-phosphatidyltransferase [Rhodothermales bacterium]